MGRVADGGRTARIVPARAGRGKEKPSAARHVPLGKRPRAVRVACALNDERPSSPPPPEPSALPFDAARVFHRRSGEIGHDAARLAARRPPRPARAARGDGVFPHGADQVRRAFAPRTDRLPHRSIARQRAVRRPVQMGQTFRTLISTRRVCRRRFEDGCLCSRQRRPRPARDPAGNVRRDVRTGLSTPSGAGWKKPRPTASISTRSWERFPAR